MIGLQERASTIQKLIDDFWNFKRVGNRNKMLEALVRLEELGALKAGTPMPKKAIVKQGHIFFQYESDGLRDQQATLL